MDWAKGTSASGVLRICVVDATDDRRVSAAVPAHAGGAEIVTPGTAVGGAIGRLSSMTGSASSEEALERAEFGKTDSMISAS